MVVNFLQKQIFVLHNPLDNANDPTKVVRSDFPNMSHF